MIFFQKKINKLYERSDNSRKIKETVKGEEKHKQGQGWHSRDTLAQAGQRDAGETRQTPMPGLEREPQLSAGLYQRPDYDSRLSNYSTGTKEGEDVFLSHYYERKRNGMCLPPFT